MDFKNEKGQSTIEFIITFIFGLGLVILVISNSFNHALGYIVHYATFMSSRVYLTADSHLGNIDNVPSSMQSANRLAKEAFRNYNLGLFNITDDSLIINAPLRGDPLTVGVYTQFELSMDPLGQVAGEKKMTLFSESYLGKEPTRAECASRTCFAITGRLENCNNMDITLFDDGC